MDKHSKSDDSDHDDNNLIHDTGAPDHLAEVYTEMVTPDIAEMNEQAATLKEEVETEPEQL